MQNKIAKCFSTPFGRGDYIFALILAILALILCAIKMNAGHNWGDDFAGYIAQAIALAQGTTAQYMADNTLMWEKTDWLFGPKAYPWGFSLLLAPLYQIFGFNIIAFKSLGIICYALFVGIFYMFCAKRLPRIYAIFATLLFAINPTMTAFVANNVLSDIPFLLFGFVALIILAKLFSESVNSSSLARVDLLEYSPSLAEGDKGGGLNTQKISGAKIVNIESTHPLAPSAREGKQRVISAMGGGRIYAILGGIFMLFSTMIRINGFVILCALIAMHGIILIKRFAPRIFKIRALQFLKRVDSLYSWKIHAIPYIIFALGFAIISLNLSSGGSGHFEMLTNINGSLILRNMDYYVEIFQYFFANEGRLTLFALCVPLICFGITDSLKGANFSENIFYVIFVGGFLALLLLWVGTQGIRFVYLLLPFAVLWGAKGLSLLNAKGQFFGRFMSVLLLIVLTNFTLGAKNINFERKISTSGAYTKEAKEAWDFIKQNTPQDSVILFHKPRVLYLNTHRIAFASNNIARFAEADFVLWERDLWKSYKAIDLSALKERVKLVYENAQFKLFKVKNGK